MPTYEISTSTYLEGHCGNAWFINQKHLTLTDEQVKTLHRVMKQAQADGEDLYALDLIDTDLRERDPELYGIIYNAYFECSYEPYFENQVNRAYDRLDWVGGIDWNQVRAICKERYGYASPDTGEEEEAIRDDRFYEWFEKNIVDTERLLDFERRENLLDLDESEFEFPEYAPLPQSLVDDYLNLKE